MTSLIETMLRRDEGYELTVYPDSEGYATCGIGHKVLPEDNLRLGDTITPERAETLFQSDLLEASDDATGAFLWLTTLDPARWAVIINMTFNMGIDTLMGFHETLAAIEAQDWQTAHDHMLKTLWAKQVGDRAKRLAYIMLTGDPSEYTA